MPSSVVKKAVIAFAFLAFFSYSQAQEKQDIPKRHRKAVFANFGGNSSMVAVLFDKRFSRTNIAWGFAAGIGYSEEFNYFIISDVGGGITIPLEINYLIGKRKNFLEIGAGVAYREVAFIDNWDSNIIPTAFLGYRYQNEKGIFFKTGFTFPNIFALGIGYGYR